MIICDFEDIYYNSQAILSLTFDFYFPAGSEYQYTNRQVIYVSWIYFLIRN